MNISEWHQLNPRLTKLNEYYIQLTFPLRPHQTSIKFHLMRLLTFDVAIFLLRFTFHEIVKRGNEYTLHSTDVIYIFNNRFMYTVQS